MENPTCLLCKHVHTFDNATGKRVIGYCSAADALNPICLARYPGDLPGERRYLEEHELKMAETCPCFEAKEVII